MQGDCLVSQVVALTGDVFLSCTLCQECSLFSQEKIHYLFFFTNRFEELIQAFSLPSHGVRTLYPTQTMMARQDTKNGGSKLSLHG